MLSILATPWQHWRSNYLAPAPASWGSDSLTVLQCEDKGLVSFTDDGTPLVSPNLSPAAQVALGIEAAKPISGLRDAHRANPAVHRARYGFLP
jgi:hypothetical protein